MPYDVFISHSSKDRLTANAVCNRLESAGIRCWIAPRDIIPGEGWSEAIMRGIDAFKVMVLVFSENANTYLGYLLLVMRAALSFHRSKR